MSQASDHSCYWKIYISLYISIIRIFTEKRIETKRSKVIFQKSFEDGDNLAYETVSSIT